MASTPKSREPSALPERKRKRLGKGCGKPPPELVLSGANLDQYHPPQKPKKGSQSEYTEAIGDRICGWVESGKSLRSFCDRSDTPDRGTVNRWLDTFPDFAAKFAKARDHGIDQLVESVIDTALTDLTPDQVPGVRTRIEAVKWYSGKIARRYAEKVSVQADVQVVSAMQVDVYCTSKC